MKQIPLRNFLLARSKDRDARYVLYEPGVHYVSGFVEPHEEACEALCWIEAKQKLGFPLSPQQDVLLADQRERAEREATKRASAEQSARTAVALS